MERISTRPDRLQNPRAFLVRRQASNRKRKPGFPVSFGKQLLDLSKFSLCQPNNRRTRAAQADAQQIRMLERQKLFKGGHQFLPVRLVNAIMQSLAQERVVAALHCLQQQSDALQS